MPKPDREFGKAVGRRIRSLREARGLTQTQLCDLTGLDSGGLSRYENGYQVPNSEAVKRLAEALAVTTDELLGVRAGDLSEKMEALLIVLPRSHREPLRHLILTFLKTHHISLRGPSRSSSKEDAE